MLPANIFCTIIRGVANGVFENIVLSSINVMLMKDKLEKGCEDE
jgi:hypothetical protein